MYAYELHQLKTLFYLLLSFGSVKGLNPNPLPYVRTSDSQSMRRHASVIVLEQLKKHIIEIVCANYVRLMEP